ESRKFALICTNACDVTRCALCKSVRRFLSKSNDNGKMKVGGPDGSRTRDLMNAIHARSQLRYWPTLGWTHKSSTSFAGAVQTGSADALAPQPRVRTSARPAPGTRGASRNECR